MPLHHTIVLKYQRQWYRKYLLNKRRDHITWGRVYMSTEWLMSFQRLCQVPAEISFNWSHFNLVPERVSEPGLTSHQQLFHTETGPRYKFSVIRRIGEAGKLSCDPWILDIPTGEFRLMVSFKARHLSKKVKRTWHDMSSFIQSPAHISHQGCSPTYRFVDAKKFSLKI